MTEEERKAWGKLVEGAKKNVRILPMNDYEIPHQTAILAASAVIQRVEDVEGITDIIQRHNMEGNPSIVAAAVRDYVMGEG